MQNIIHVAPAFQPDAHEHTEVRRTTCEIGKRDLSEERPNAALYISTP